MPPESVGDNVSSESAPHRLLSRTTIGFFGAFLLLSLGFSMLLAWAESKYVASVESHIAAGAKARERDAFENLSLQARSAYVIDLTTNTTLFARNEDIPLPLASITKVALVLAVAEALEKDDRVVISRGAVERGEGGGLGTGDTWLVRDLIDFTLLASSNAGAEALAESAEAALQSRYPAPEGKAAVSRMNALMRELGFTKTFFLNPSGLDISQTQASAFSSARETALLVAYAASTAPELFSATTRSDALLGPENGAKRIVMNTNSALSNIPGLLLGKTGFTDLAGGNLAVVFEIEPLHPIAAAVMGSSNEGRFEDMRKIIDATQKTIIGRQSQ